MANTEKLRRRPPKTSREEIVATAIAMLQEHPIDELSIKKITQKLDITPMAFYNHLDNKHQLMQAIAHELLAGLKPQLSKTGSWQANIENWVRAVREYFLQHPYLINLLGWEGHVSASWLERLTDLLELLPPTPHLSDAERLLLAQWIQHSVVGFLYLEIGFRKENVGVSSDDFNILNSAAAEQLTELLPTLTTYDPGSMFELNLKQMMNALSVECEQRS